MLKNKFTIGTLALLLSLGLVGTAFASDRNYIELDVSDYSEGQYGFDANPNQADRAVNTEVVQNKTSEPAIAGLVSLIELDESDYEDAQSDTKISERVLCAKANGSGSTEQANNCG